jgi:hypothetical protein
MGDKDNLLKRRLGFEKNSGNVLTITSTDMIVDDANATNFGENNKAGEGEKKRQKKADGSTFLGLITGSVASLEDDSRSQ